MMAMTTSSSMRVKARGRVEGGRMGRMLNGSCAVRTLNVWKRVKVKELKGFPRELPFLTLQSITPTSPSVPGMGIVRNRNCPACKSLRRSGAALVGARQCAEILSGGDHFQKDASQRFRVAGSITARATSRILSKAVQSARREP